MIYPVTETAHLSIPLPDGTQLSARIWRPEGAGPVPAILEYLPYRKRDGTAARDAITHPYMAARGYACVRVDLRGCGDSEGLFDDEYSPQELGDGVAVIDWLAKQDWCDGAVGMVGISWGGFNGLQIAALRPPALKAVVTICSTVDRFADDIHYKGGVMLTENPSWAATALSWFSMPPDPEIVGPGWRDQWLERLEHTPFLAQTWSEHQTRDAYWRHGSVCEDYSAIQAAVLTVGGWHDGYRNTMAHLLENLGSPVKGIVGPWNHKYPHIAMPGPQIDFLGEMLRWWDHYLKGIDRGCDTDPDLRAYLMDSLPPQLRYETRPGQWVGVTWPTRQTPETFDLGPEGLHPSLPRPGLDPGPHGMVHPRLHLGQGTGSYFPGYGVADLPDDQTADNARATCFETGPLEARDLLGAPEVTLRLTADRPLAQIAVRLSDLRPDGTAALIAHGFRNLSLNDDLTQSRPLDPDRPVDIRLTLDQCGYRLPKGHRLCLAISSSYWPLLWPDPEPVTLRILEGRMSLPVVTGAAPAAFAPAPEVPGRATEDLRAPEERKTITRDLGGGQIDTVVFADSGAIRDLETGLVTEARKRETLSITPPDPTTARATYDWERSLSRGEWKVATQSRIDMQGHADHFEIHMSLDAQENGTEIFSRRWSAQVPRLGRS